MTQFPELEKKNQSIKLISENVSNVYVKSRKNKNYLVNDYYRIKY